MKKFLAILLSILMIFTITACGNTSVEDTPSDVTAAVDDTSAPEEEVAVFTPIALVHNDNLVFKVMAEPYLDKFWDGYSVDVYVENPINKTVYVALVETSVNGYMIDPYFTVEIAAGKKANETFTFMKDDLDKNGITESIDNISFKVAVYDSEWNEIWCSDPLSVDFE